MGGGRIFESERRSAWHTPGGIASGLVFALIVAAASAPFAGWRLPLVWFFAIAALVVAERWLEARRPDKAAGGGQPFNPFAWLINTGYSAAALYLVFFFGGAAQTLGVTLYGVVMFQILAQDYASPRRLMANLLVPVLSVVAVQLYATSLLVQGGQPWRILTLIASPLIVYCVFRAVQHHLNRSRQLEQRALDRLTESETRYRLLADSSPDTIVRYDLEGRIEYVSPAARQYGADPDALVGLNVRDLLNPGEWERNDAFLADLTAGRPLPKGEQNVWRVLGVGDEALAFEGATSPITNDEGRVIGAIATLRDVTVRQALQDELEHRREEAEAATLAKSQFLANMSHEIRSPLTGIIGFSDLLTGIKDLPEKAKTYVRRIETSCELLLAIVNEVLDFSELEAGQVKLDPQPFAVRKVFAQAIEMFLAQAGAKSIDLALMIEEGVPDQLLADSARLRQVLSNLLSNAIKFTDKGSVNVMVQYDPSQARLRVAVSDTGVGIADDNHDLLFQRFSQVDGSVGRRFGGSGLGLSICRNLVELMGGEISVRSTIGVGSTFEFWIVAHPVAPDHQSGDLHGEPAPEKNSKILVVDDIDEIRELVRAILEEAGQRVEEARSGSEAVTTATRTGFDLILMDLQMPGMDGFAAARAIRNLPELNQATPIVALSANVLPEHLQACASAGMNDHVGKPIQRSELVGAVRRWGGVRLDDPDQMSQLFNETDPFG